MALARIALAKTVFRETHTMTKASIALTELIEKGAQDEIV